VTLLRLNYWNTKRPAIIFAGRFAVHLKNRPLLVVTTTFQPLLDQPEWQPNPTSIKRT